MNPHRPFPPVGAIIEVHTTKLVGRFYPYKGWLIAAKTRVPVSWRSHGTSRGTLSLREGILRLLWAARYPAALKDDEKGVLLPEKHPCECPLAQRVTCFQHLKVVRKASAQQAAIDIAQTSDPRYPRHDHCTADQEGHRTSVLVFMDEHGRKGAAKRWEGPHVAAVTCFQVEDCDPAAPNAWLKSLAEWCRQQALFIARSVASDRTIYTPLSWGY